MTVLETRPPGVYPKFDESITDWALHEDVIDWDVVPFSMGPTWTRAADVDWQGPVSPDGYILPEYTIGYQAISWVSDNLLADETDEDDKPLPFRLTPEQVRFILWFYAVDIDGKFLYREVVLQRLKGHGKDPLAVVIAAIEFVGPCRFKGWAARDMPEIGLVKGDPVAKPHARSWIQVAAVSLSQTQNTMALFRGVFTDACIAEHGIDTGKEVIYAYGGKKQIQAVTSSPRALEGNRPTLVIVNEPHQWIKTNEGIAMFDAIERNATKAKGGAARVLGITNAYEPSEESVGRMLRESYDQRPNGKMYDTLEAPKQARLRPVFPDEMQGAEERNVPIIDQDVKERLTKLYIRRVLEVVRGGAWWLDIPNLTESILDPKNKASRSRRFWYNQITANEDAWLHPMAVDLARRMDVVELRNSVSDHLLKIEAGWQPVSKFDRIVMFFDGSKNDDSTAIVGCRLSDGYCFLIGVWEKPKGERGEKWMVNRAAVSKRVDLAFTRFNVVAFWGDPSHTKDSEEEDDSSYWMPSLDLWMQKYKDTLDPLYWPVKSGMRKHAINFDMTSAERTKVFIDAAEQVVEDLENLNDIEEFEPTFQIDGHPVLVRHMKNAIKHYDPRGWGTSLSKEQKDSPRKIDAAVCLVGARMLRRVVLNAHKEEEIEEPGEIWGALSTREAEEAQKDLARQRIAEGRYEWINGRRVALDD